MMLRFGRRTKIFSSSSAVLKTACTEAVVVMRRVMRSSDIVGTSSDCSTSMLDGCAATKGVFCARRTFSETALSVAADVLGVALARVPRRVLYESSVLGEMDRSVGCYLCDSRNEVIILVRSADALLSCHVFDDLVLNEGGDGQVGWRMSNL